MTLLTLSMPWQFTAALFPVFLSLLSLIARHVRKSIGLYYLPRNRGEHEVTAAAVSWLFAAAATVVMLSPLSQRLPAFFHPVSFQADADRCPDGVAAATHDRQLSAGWSGGFTLEARQ